MVDVVVILSIITSITSIIPAIFAILFSMQVEERLKKNFLRLKDIMDNNHERTKEVLANMDREAEDIKQQSLNLKQNSKKHSKISWMIVIFLENN